jgi:hypothetical protein
MSFYFPSSRASTGKHIKFNDIEGQEAGSEPQKTKHHYPTHPESRLAQNEWSKQLQHGVNEACEPPVLADRQLEGCSAMTSTRSKFMIERQNHQFAHGGRHQTATPSKRASMAALPGPN